MGDKARHLLNLKVLKVEIIFRKKMSNYWQVFYWIIMIKNDITFLIILMYRSILYKLV